jgi:osmotically-inducible protein OsmY
VDLDEHDDVEEPPPMLTGRPLADQVRSHLSADPRTADLPGLAINVAEGTVFVRGSVPAGYQESAIREVISSVPGVNDVDLQVSAST